MRQEPLFLQRRSTKPLKPADWVTCGGRSTTKSTPQPIRDQHCKLYAPNNNHNHNNNNNNNINNSLCFTKPALKLNSANYPATEPHYKRERRASAFFVLIGVLCVWLSKHGEQMCGVQGGRQTSTRKVL